MDNRRIEDQALRVLVHERIATLWRHRAWFRTHVGWIVQEQVDERAELRYLIALARQARKVAGPPQDEIFEGWKRARDLDLSSGDHFAGMPS
jgi:hypothetical protein